MQNNIGWAVWGTCCMQWLAGPALRAGFGAGLDKARPEQVHRAGLVRDMHCMECPMLKQVCRVACPVPCTTHSSGFTAYCAQGVGRGHMLPVGCVLAAFGTGGVGGKG